MVKDAPMGKNQETVPVRKSGSNLTPRPDGVKMSPSGSKDKPADAWIKPKATANDKERPVISEPADVQAPWRKGSAGSSKFTPKNAK